MIDHQAARDLASARFDGELDAASERALEAHLAACPACSAYAAGLAPLRALAAELPREHAPADLPARVAAGLGTRRPRRGPARRPLWRLAPALAAALAVALIAVIVQPITRFTLPLAEAAEALTRIRTLFVEREVVQVAQPELGIERSRSVQRIWFRAPAFVRVETRVEGGPAGVVVTRPGELYEPGGAGRLVGLPPDPDLLPEPISPTIALIGRPAGPGPTIAGRPTTRFVVDFGEGRRREAFVDTARFLFLETEDFLVLGKVGAFGGRSGTIKRVLRVEVNRPIPDALFAIPSVEPIDHGFRERPPLAIRGAPLAAPKDFGLVRAGETADGRATIQYARGALLVTVLIGEPLSVPGPTEQRREVSLGTGRGTILLDLYALPRIHFTHAGRDVTIVAPLPPAQLAELARKMYPA
jgi:anti-sigma factor RsiW